MSATSDFYLACATECAVEAQRTTLENVRERCLRSQTAWLAMADRYIRAETMRAELIANKQALAFVTESSEAS
jgi:hypothetical protein